MGWDGMGGVSLRFMTAAVGVISNMLPGARILCQRERVWGRGWEREGKSTITCILYVYNRE